MLTLIKYEVKKNFFTPLMLVIVLIGTIVNVGAIINDVYNKSVLLPDPKMHNAFFTLYNDFKGELSKEKLEKLIKLYNPLQEAVADHTASGAQNDNGLTGSTFGDYNVVNRYFYEPIKQFYQYKNYAAQIKNIAYDNVQFYSEKQNNYEVLCNTKIYQLFENRSIDKFEYTEFFERVVEYKSSNYILLIICLFAASCVYPKENETQMNKLILISKTGSYKSTLAKTIACAIFVVITSIWIAFVDYVGFAALLKSGDGVFMPLYSLIAYQNTPLNISLFAFYVLKTALRILGLLCVCFIGLTISLPFSNAFYPTIINICCSVALFGVATTNSNTSYLYRQILNPLSLICPEILVTKTNFINIFGLPVLVLSASVIFSCFLIIVLILMLFALAPKSLNKKRSFFSN